MITKPDKIKFESSMDVVDYISKGIVPTRRNFDDIIQKVRYPDEEGSTPVEGKPYMPRRIFINISNDEMIEVLDRVYKNRVRNRNIRISIASIITAGLLFCGISNHQSKKDDDEEDEEDND